MIATLILQVTYLGSVLQILNSQLSSIEGRDEFKPTTKVSANRFLLGLEDTSKHGRGCIWQQWVMLIDINRLIAYPSKHPKRRNQQERVDSRQCMNEGWDTCWVPWSQHPIAWNQRCRAWQWQNQPIDPPIAIIQYVNKNVSSYHPYPFVPK